MRACYAALLLILIAGCRQSQPIPPTIDEPPLFEDVTDASGIRFTYRNGEEANRLAILESLGGGVGVLDYDGDGKLDLFFPGGGYFDGDAIRGYPPKLYRNLGGCKFEDVTAAVGLDSAPFYSHGVAVADYDRDGWPDLLVTGWGRIALYHNVPDGKGGRRFVYVSIKAVLDKGIAWATSAGWADLDGDGWPDLYVCQYVNWSPANDPPCYYDGKLRDVCPPRNFHGLPHKLYRNQRDGTFRDVSQEAGLLPGGADRSKGLGVLLVDVNGDGKPDIYVANDTVDKFLYVNESTPGSIRLKEQGLHAGVARDGDGAANGSMGLDAADVDGSGKPWLWVTNYENEMHGLYRNLTNGERILFDYASTSTGIAAVGRKYVGWGTGFFDIDHHGYPDLFIAHGHAIRYPTGKASARAQRPVLLRNESG